MQWFDLYDKAAGAGYDSRSIAPDVDATVGVVAPRLASTGLEAEEFSRRAKEIGKICREAHRKKGAVSRILELVE